MGMDLFGVLYEAPAKEVLSSSQGICLDLSSTASALQYYSLFSSVDCLLLLATFRFLWNNL